MNVRITTYVGKEEQGKFVANIKDDSDIEQVVRDVEEFLYNQLYESEEDGY